MDPIKKESPPALFDFEVGVVYRMLAPGAEWNEGGVEECRGV